jgi:hypothetical protein
LVVLKHSLILIAAVAVITAMVLSEPGKLIEDLLRDKSAPALDNANLGEWYIDPGTHELHWFDNVGICWQMQNMTLSPIEYRMRDTGEWTSNDERKAQGLKGGVYFDRSRFHVPGRAWRWCRDSLWVV